MHTELLSVSNLIGDPISQMLFISTYLIVHVSVVYIYDQLFLCMTALKHIIEKTTFREKSEKS